MDTAIQQLLGTGAVGAVAVIFIYLWNKKDKELSEARGEHLADVKGYSQKLEEIIAKNNDSIDELATLNRSTISELAKGATK